MGGKTNTEKSTVGVGEAAKRQGLLTSADAAPAYPKPQHAVTAAAKPDITDDVNLQILQYSTSGVPEFIKNVALRAPIGALGLYGPSMGNIEGSMGALVVAEEIGAL